MEKEELSLICKSIEAAREKVDGMQLRERGKIQDIEVIRAMLAASWSLRVARFTLQLAVDRLDLYHRTTKGLDSDRKVGGQ